MAPGMGHDHPPQVSLCWHPILGGSAVEHSTQYGKPSPQFEPHVLIKLFLILYCMNFV